MATALPPGITDAVKGMSATRRILVLGVAVSLVVAALVASQWATAPQFISLYRDVELAQMAEVTAELERAAVPYRLGHDGAEVLVRQADLARARVLLAAKHLPRSGRPGFEIFDAEGTMLGKTDVELRMQLRRAMEGELARTIGEFAWVERATVHVAMPEQSALRRLQQPAKASVLITPRRGVPAPTDAVESITYLVANAVEGLQPSQVSVTDNSGRLLASSGDAEGTRLSDKQKEQQVQEEGRLRRKAEELLTSLLGPSQSTVSVAVELDFDERTIGSESFMPDSQVIVDETVTEAGASEGGQGGTARQTKYQNTSRREERRVAVGRLRKLSASVLVDERALARISANGGTRTAPQQLAALDTVMRSALGVDTARGDVLKVLAMPLEGVSVTPVGTTPADSTPAAPGVVVLVERFGRPGIVVLALLLAFALGWRALKPAAPPVPAGVLATGAAAGAFGPGAAGNWAPKP
ncbi:MAG: flagellar basal-body MS-ring/collar protein FliF, partial [Gemmatimonadales bacterium]|nr:flagellar basal-body MS-ring/collar protein FliF [Gemmatimonadales bacterium]